MGVYIGLLRAVNLGAYNKVAMVDLRRVLVKVGMQEPRSLLQSGNVVFRSAVSSAAKLERALEEGLEEHLNVKTEIFVRTAKEWKAVIAANPFPAEAERDPSRLLVVFYRKALDLKAVAELQTAIRGPERVEAQGNQAYIVYPDGMGRSTLPGTLIDRKLGMRGTGRNWNTVLKLGALTDQ